MNPSWLVGDSSLRVLPFSFTTYVEYYCSDRPANVNILDYTIALEK